MSSSELNANVTSTVRPHEHLAFGLSNTIITEHRTTEQQNNRTTEQQNNRKCIELDFNSIEKLT